MGKINWENHHSNNDQYWLTGSSVSSIEKYHRISLKSYSHKKIMEIGVGQGHFTNQLKNYTNEIFAVDISKFAIDKVSNFAKSYLTQELKNIEPVDFVICHLVFQHCTNEEVIRIINDVNLTKNGVFSFQYAYLRNPRNHFSDPNIVLNSTHFFRSQEYMREIINNSNKKIIEAPFSIQFQDFNWEIIKVVNK